MYYGNWSTQNKSLPGVYVRYRGEGAVPSVAGDRGTAALPFTFPWLEEQKVIELTASEAVALAARYGSGALLIQEMAKNASKLLIYRLNKGVAATATVGIFTATARYSGTYGNRISVSIVEAVEPEGSFHVITWLDAEEVERQTIAAASELQDNDYVTFTAGSGSLAAAAGVKLTGGTDGTVANSDHTDALTAFESREFDALACPFDDSAVKTLYTAWARRMITEDGVYPQVVVPDASGVDFEAVISVKNGVYLEDGTHVDKAAACAYIAGATAACALSGSLTNAAYIGAVNVDTRYTRSQRDTLSKSGQLVFLPPTAGNNTVTIEKDINTLTGFGAGKTYALSKNKVIRTLYTLNRDVIRIAGRYYQGKEPNNENGRSKLKAAILARLRELEGLAALQNVAPESVEVLKGDLIDSAVVNLAVQPVDVVETFYTSVTVEG